MGMMQNVMTLTDAAADQVKSLMALGEARAEGGIGLTRRRGKGRLYRHEIRCPVRDDRRRVRRSC